MERLTGRVPPDLLKEIEDREDREDVSTSEAARQLLRRGVEADDLDDSLGTRGIIYSSIRTRP